MSHRKATLLLIAASVLWSLGGVLLQAVQLPTMVKAGWRCGFAAIALALWLRPIKLSATRLQSAIAVAYASTLVLFVIANDHTTAANAIFLQYTAPIYIAIAGRWLLNERATGRDWLFILIALGGIALFFRDGLAAGRWVGDLIALGSGVSFATMAMLMRRERHGSPESAMLMGNALGFAVALPWILSTSPTAHEWLILAVLGVVQIAIPYILYTTAIRHVTALEAVLIPSMEPILNPIWVAIFRGQVPGPWAIAGAALVLGAVVGRGLLSRRTPEAP